MTESTILAELHRIRAMLSSRTEQSRPIAVDSGEAARLLGISKSTLASWTRAGKIKRLVEGGVVRYRVADLEAFAEERVKVTM